MYTAILNSVIGSIEIKGEALGISSVTFLRKKIADTPEDEVPDPLIKAYQQLSEYFSRKRKTFDLKLHPGGTDFQKRVWEELVEIPWGNTTNYLEMAKRLGDPKVIRAQAGKGVYPLWIRDHLYLAAERMKVIQRRQQADDVSQTVAALDRNRSGRRNRIRGR